MFRVENVVSNLVAFAQTAQNWSKKFEINSILFIVLKFNFFLAFNFWKLPLREVFVFKFKPVQEHGSRRVFCFELLFVGITMFDDRDDDVSVSLDRRGLPVFLKVWMFDPSLTLSTWFLYQPSPLHRNSMH